MMLGVSIQMIRDRCMRYAGVGFRRQVHSAYFTSRIAVGPIQKVYT